MRTKSRVTSLVTAAVLAASLFGLTSVIASGVTVITHGFQFSGLGYPGWVDEMAKAVTNAAHAKGLNSSWYHLRVTGNVFSGINAVISRRSAASATDTSEVVFTVNWADVADHNAISSPGITTADIAGWVAGGLRMVDSSIGLGQPLASRHIHLIGHSRGGSVVLETARILGSFGIWVDHITTLDPHPLSLGDTGVYSPPGWHPGDPAARLYENVVFADNYWRKDDIPSPGDFNGQGMLGAEDIQLSESILSGGGYLSEHSDVHAWYHGTIGSGSSFPSSDGEVTIPDSWYALPHPARHLSGFFFSRIANGSLLYRPAFSYAIGTKFGGRHVRETTSRAGGSQWANIGFIQTPAFPNNKYPQGQPITASFKYQDRDSGVRVEWFIDSDKNPFNNAGNPMVVQTYDSTGDKVSSSSVSIPTVGLSVSPPRYLLAKITSLNNNAVRYEYADNSFTITWPDFVLQEITPASVVAGAGVTRLTLNGSAFGVDDKVLFFNGTTTTPITPVSRTASQIVVDFDFGATLRTWSVSVQQYVDGLPYRASESLPVEVRSSNPTGPSITTQPGDATTIFGQTATFSVVATGSGTLSYQWQRNGLAIDGATSTSYTTSPVSFAHDGYTYLVRVTDANGTTSSRLATLDVVAAATPCDDPAEPNNSSLTATPLALGATTSGFICSSADVDWFKVVITESGQLNLALMVPDGLDYDLELYGPDATWVAGSYEETGQAESIVRTVSPGNYYARVYSHPLGQGLFSTSQAYQLSANAAEVNPPGPTSGPITSTVVWSGVVELTGDVTIMSGGLLKIMPGTQVRCASNDDRASGNDSSRVEIIVNGGTLDASGAPDALIRFTSRAQNPFAGDWSGLRVVEGDVTMTHCLVEYAIDGIRFEDTDTRFNDYALGNVTVQRCSGSGVWTTSGQFASVTLNNFQLWTNATGLSANGPVTLVGGQLVGNNGSGFSGNSATLMATGTILSRNVGYGINNYYGGVTLTGCVVTNNQGPGVFAYQTSLTMSDCTVLKNSGDGVYAQQGTALNMSGCTVSQNNGLGVGQYSGGTAEVRGNLVQSNSGGGLALQNVTVGVVSNTISSNLGTGLLLANFGVSASGVAGNVITGNGSVGLHVSGSGPSLLTVSGNDIYQNTNFELRNDSSTTVIASGNYWGNPTGTELNQGQKNLSRIYDILDGGSQQVLIPNWYAALLSSGNPGTLQNFAYNLPGVTQVSGTINSAQTWSGTVLVIGDVTVAGSLTIAAGTTVRFDSLHDAEASGNDRSRCELIVNGSLIAEGTPGAPILFTSSATAKNPGDWHGIRVVQGDVTLTNCVVEYAMDGIRFENANTQSRNYVLGNVTVQRCSGSGVWTTSGQFASVTLNNFQLWTNATGLSANGPVTLVGGQLVGNNGSGFSGNSATLMATGTILSRNVGYGINNYYGGVTLTGCVVTNNQGPGVFAYQTSLTMSDCTVLKNSGDGVYAQQGTALNMSGCTVSQNNGLGVGQYSGGTAEVRGNLVQSNSGGGLALQNVTVGVVSNTISSNLGTGLLLANFGVSASGVAGNVITGNGSVGLHVSGSGPSLLTVSGNEIYQNTNFELRNDSSTTVIASGNYWGNPTGTELNQGQKNLSRIYDILDGGSQQVLIPNWYAALLSSGNPGTLQNFAYNLPGVTQVSGTINSAQTWSGTVLVIGDVTVAGSLTIAAGTTVRFDSLHDAEASGNDRSRCELIVNGSLIAEGTPGAPILFTSSATAKNPGDWHGIRVVQGDVTLTNCVVEYAMDGIRFENANTQSRNYVLGNVTVQRCSGSGVWTTSGQFASVTLNNFQLWTNATGLSANGPVTLVGGQLVGNNGSGFSGNSATLMATGTILSRNVGYGINNYYGGVTLTGCVVTNNQGPGVFAYQTSLTMSDCTVLKNSGDGVYAQQGTALNMSGCTVSQNNGLGVGQYSGGTAEVRGNLVQSNSGGGLALQNVTVGVVSNTISSNLGTGLLLANFGVSASGVAGNVITGNGSVGLHVSGSGPSLLTVSGNDIYQNTNFELRNESSIPITATSCYWAEPTSTELNQNQVNLTRIYDQRDNSSYGLVTVQNPRFVPIGQVFGTPPNITQHPQSQTKLAGSTVIFTVAASGSTPFSYQWRKNGNPISGGAGATLALLNVQMGDAGSYSVVVSNSAGTATSSNATLNVTGVPANLAVRTIARTGEIFSISLAISPPADAGFGFVQEVLPVGFTASGVNGGGVFNPLTGTVLWGPLADNQVHQLSYTLGLPIGFVDSTALDGTAYFFGTSHAVTGDSIVSTLPPDTRARLTMTRLAGFFAVSIEGEVGRSYRVEARDSLISGQWEPLATVTMFTSPRVYIDADSIGKSRRFYRTVLIE